jgi:hypothetical protein
MLFPPAAQAAACLALTPMSERDANTASGLIGAGVSRESVLAQITQWEIEPVAMMNLLQLQSRGWLADSRSMLESASQAARATVLSRTLTTTELIGRLRRSGVESILIKGPATAMRAYGDPSLRSFRDADLLLREYDLPLARSLFINWGYSAAYNLADEKSLVAAGHALEFNGRLIKVELHSSLLSHFLGVRFGDDDVWAKSGRETLAGSDIRVLNVCTEIIYLCAHAAKHHWNAFRWICDIAQLIRRLSEGEIRELTAQASRLHAKRLTGLGIALAESAFGLEIPSDLHTLSRERAVTKMAAEILRGYFNTARDPLWLTAAARIHGGLPQLFFWMSVQDRLSDRLASITHLALGDRLRGR